MTPTKFDIIAGIIILVLLAISFYNHSRNNAKAHVTPQQLGVNDLIRNIKTELINTERNRIKNNESALFKLKDFELEIKFVVNETSTTSGQIEYSVVTIGTAKEISAEKVQSIKLRMTAISPKTDTSYSTSEIKDTTNITTIGTTPPPEKK